MKRVTDVLALIGLVLAALLCVPVVAVAFVILMGERAYTALFEAENVSEMLLKRARRMRKK
jgi:hypothetical protein